MNIVGVKEAAEILGWSRKKVSAYYPRGLFPVPIKMLYSGPIWFEKQITTYKQLKINNARYFYVNHGEFLECSYNKPPQPIEITFLNKLEEHFYIYSEDVLMDIQNVNKLKVDYPELNDTPNMAIYKDFQIIPREEEIN